MMCTMVFISESTMYLAVTCVDESQSDAWAWSLGNLFAFIGVIVAGLGAVATVSIAIFALKATNRANRLGAEARERTGRLAFAAKVEDYLAGWEANPYYYLDTEDGQTRHRDLLFMTAGQSSDAAAVTAWMFAELSRVCDQVVGEYEDVNEGERMLSMSARGAASAMRRRTIHWVSTGTFDRTPLTTPSPPA